MALLGGFSWLWLFDKTPGASGRPVALWPADTGLNRNSVGPTLVMTVHPRCTCSSAGISELARVVARTPEALRVYVLAAIPKGESDKDWQQTTLLARAREIPGVKVVNDVGGIEASRFGGATSGYTM